VGRGRSACTRPRAHLGFGQVATVGWIPPSVALGPGAHKALTFQVTVESIENETIADFKNVDLSAKQKKMTPDYVLRHLPAVRGGIRAQALQRQARRESCFAYLLPGGGSIRSVEWNDAPTPASGVSAYFDKPIVSAAS
jgi:hypothetical protein